MTELNAKLLEAVKENLGSMVGEELQKELQAGKEAKESLEISENQVIELMDEVKKLKDTIELLESQKRQWNQLEAKEKTLMETERNLRVRQANLERDSALEFKRLVKDYLMKSDD